MGFTVKLNFQAMKDVLKDVIDLTAIEKAVKDFTALPDNTPLLQKVTAIAGVIATVVGAIEWSRVQDGMTADDAISLSVNAVDALVVFEGTVLGFIPIGSIIEAYDNLLVQLLVKLAYEAIRGRNFQPDYKEVIGGIVGGGSPFKM